MKRLIFGIFAHPDDEAFGPSATLLKEVQAGAELHLISVTAGEGGANPDGHADLGKARAAEWRAAAQALGAVSANLLNFADGGLCNAVYHQVAAQIEGIVRQTCAVSKPCELSFMTFHPNGLTGHLDHIAVSYITTYVFYKLKTNPPQDVRVEELAYFCLSESQAPQANPDYFVFMPAGQPAEAINREVSVASLLPQKFKIMRLHHTQRGDCDAVLSRGEEFHKTDHFVVIR